MRQVRTLSTVVAMLLCILSGIAQVHRPLPPEQYTPVPESYGPFNGTFLAGGVGLVQPLREKDPVFGTDVPWTMSCWVRTDAAITGSTLLAGVGDPLEEYSRYFSIEHGKLALRMSDEDSLASTAVLSPSVWHLLAASFDGTANHLYLDGQEVASGKLILGTVRPVFGMAPAKLPLLWTDGEHFSGKIAQLTLRRASLDQPAMAALYRERPEFGLIVFEQGSRNWPVQTRGMTGQQEPQDPATLPRSKAPFGQPVAKSLPPTGAALEHTSENHWTIARGWRLAEGPKVSGDGGAIARTAYDAKNWMAATVPGTVLTTMVDRGIYPDPDYGLNNLAIPESLNKQDYWYRTEFTGPRVHDGQRLALTLNGINYAAEVWLNGRDLGEVRGAFIRGVFDVTKDIEPGRANALAIHIFPPPHPGLPHEQSIKAGPGENGGMMVLDGPTFAATEGWDWIPSIRDRDTGLWQDVTLEATGAVRIEDPQVVTTLPLLPDTSRADVAIAAPLLNTADKPVRGELTASFDTVTVTKSVTLAPGENSVKLAPAEFPQLAVANPRLWWPNGYGKPELHTLHLSFKSGGDESDAKDVRFGIREITYEVSLFDSAGRLRRVEVDPSRADGKPVVDVTHEGMRQVPDGWASSLMPGAEQSPAVRPSADIGPAPYLVIKVNGVRIACRGGNWGMDDARKRVSRERLEPYFRLHHDANLNMIRNWMGQNTEETFYDLADEYGLLVWNDFWDSTQNYNLEAEDPALFLRNAKDTILRFRNHPSIAMWCGRNEGVPQGAINKGLIELTTALDGTRYYSPSSNQVNLQNSGPYKYQDPSLYFTTLNRGFSVETGTASLMTLESMRRWIPEADRWPVSDTWAYHDWHQTGNGEVAPFMEHLEDQFGAATNLEDFERKAQMLNYVDHRAIFEGMDAHLWMPNSGRLLWMTQPAWPSTMWQILTSDYDTQASFYGVKKACEPVHVQLNLPDYSISVVNTTTQPMPGLTMTATVYTPDGKVLLERAQAINAAMDAVTAGPALGLTPQMLANVVYVKLQLKDAGGRVLSDNFYWLAAEEPTYRQMLRLPSATIQATATATKTQDMTRVHVQLVNRGTTVALANKLTLLSAGGGAQVLPAYLSDNYVSLMPGESREIDIEYPAKAAKGAVELSLRGWNLAPVTVPVSQP